MQCQRCNSERVLSIHAHSRDLFNCEIGDIRHEGYAPAVPNICNGDDVEADICLACGQVQGMFPLPPLPIERGALDEDDLPPEPQRSVREPDDPVDYASYQQKVAAAVGRPKQLPQFVLPNCAATDHVWEVADDQLTATCTHCDYTAAIADLLKA